MDERKPKWMGICLRVHSKCETVLATCVGNLGFWGVAGKPSVVAVAAVVVVVVVVVEGSAPGSDPGSGRDSGSRSG